MRWYRVKTLNGICKMCIYVIRRICVCFIVCAISGGAVLANPIFISPWGFIVDFPQEYDFTGGDRTNSYSFSSQQGGVVDMYVYGAGEFKSLKDAVNGIQRKIRNTAGEAEFFEYRKKNAAIMELSIEIGRNVFTGYGLCVELDPQEGSAHTPILVALAYGAQEKSEELGVVYISCLDSIAVNTAAFYAPGAITEYSFPRGERQSFPLAKGAGEALFFEHDAEAAQFVVDREELVLRRYVRSLGWKEAWQRFYRIVYRDSFERLQSAAFTLERGWNVPPLDNRAFAETVLKWTQEFVYERDIEGSSSDFVNLVSAAVEGRGDCDSRAMLWAIVLQQANIPAAIMVSRDYSHAMGLADVEGDGARFALEGTNYLVAETTAHVDIGMIGQSISETDKWIGVSFF